MFKGADENETKVRSNDEGEGHMFRSQNELVQQDVNKIVKKFQIPNDYIC